MNDLTFRRLLLQLDALFQHPLRSYVVSHAELMMVVEFYVVEISDISLTPGRLFVWCGTSVGLYGLVQVLWASLKKVPKNI